MTPAKMSLASPKLRQGKPTRIHTPKPRKKRTDATQGVRESLAPRVCECGCLETFSPQRKDQRFLQGHRFRSYKTHSCPDCGIIHRMKAGYEE